MAHAGALPPARRSSRSPSRRTIAALHALRSAEAPEETDARRRRNSSLLTAAVEAGEEAQRTVPVPRVYLETMRCSAQRREIEGARPAGSLSHYALRSATMPLNARLLGLVSPHEALGLHALPVEGLTREQERALQVNKRAKRAALAEADEAAAGVFAAHWGRDGEGHRRAAAGGAERARAPPRLGSALTLSYALREAAREDAADPAAAAARRAAAEAAAAAEGGGSGGGSSGGGSSSGSGRGLASQSFRLAGAPPHRATVDILELLAATGVPVQQPRERAEAVAQPPEPQAAALSGGSSSASVSGTEG